LWDSLSGRSWGEPLAADRATVLAVVVDAAGVERLAVGDKAGTVRIWDVESGVEVAAARTGHDRGVCSIVAVADASMAVAAHDGSVRVWRLDDDGPPRLVREPHGYTPSFELRSVFASDGTTRTAFSHQIVDSDGEDTVIRVYAGLWDPSTELPWGHLVRSSRWTGRDFAGWCDAQGAARLVFAQQEVEVCDLGDGSVHHPRWWDLDAVDTVEVFAGPQGTPWLAGGGRDGTVRLVDLVTGKPARPPLFGPAEPAAAITAFRGPEGRPMLAAGYYDTVRVWDLALPQDDTALPPPGHSGRVTVRTSPPPLDGAPALVATYGGGDQTVRRWDQSTGQSLGEPIEVGGRRLVSRLDASLVWVPLPSPEDGFGIACGTYLGGLRRWSARTGRAVRWPRRAPLGRAPGHSRDAVTFTDRAGKHLLATVFSHTFHKSSVRIWDAVTGRPVRRWGRPVRFRLPRNVHAIAVFTGPDGRSLIAACAPDRVRLWNGVTGARIRVPVTLRDAKVVGPSSLLTAFHTDEGTVLLAAVNGDNAIRIWNPWTGDLVAEPDSGHRAKMHTLVTLPGSPARLASGDKDGTLRIWEPLTGADAGTLNTGAPIHDLAVGAAGTLFVAGPGGLTAIDL
jgi:WD40 repeat protein